jgi:hypothetical protein
VAEQLAAILVLVVLFACALWVPYMIGALACALTGVERGRLFKVGIGFFGTLLARTVSVSLRFVLPFWAKGLLAIALAAAATFLARRVWRLLTARRAIHPGLFLVLGLLVGCGGREEGPQVEEEAPQESAEDKLLGEVLRAPPIESAAWLAHRGEREARRREAMFKRTAAQVLATSRLTPDQWRRLDASAPDLQGLRDLMDERREDAFAEIRQIQRGEKITSGDITEDEGGVTAYGTAYVFCSVVDAFAETAREVLGAEWVEAVRGPLAIAGIPVADRLERAKRDRVQAHFESLRTAIEIHYLEHRELPASLKHLEAKNPNTGEPYLASVPRDPWARAYVYTRLDERKWRLVSLGPDGQEGTDDDIAWPPPDDG